MTPPNFSFRDSDSVPRCDTYSLSKERKKMFENSEALIKISGTVFNLNFYSPYRIVSMFIAEIAKKLSLH
jgi:hypothetical protein